MDTNRALNYKTLLPKETLQYEYPTIYGSYQHQTY